MESSDLGEFDMTISVHGQEFKAHSAVLSEYSPYFETMLNSGFKEEISKKIIFDSFEPEIFSSVLTFIYTSECEISDILELYIAAEFLRVYNLMAYVLLNVEDNLDNKNCLKVLRFAFSRGFESLSIRVIHGIVKHNLLILCDEDDYNWNYKLLKRVFSYGYFRHMHTLSFVQYLKYWIVVDPVQRIPLIRSLVSSILQRTIVADNIVDFVGELPFLIGRGRIIYKIYPTPNLKIYIIGGSFKDQFPSHNEIHTVPPPARNLLAVRKTSLPCMDVQKTEFGIALDRNGLYVIGGRSECGRLMDSVSYFEFDRNRWSVHSFLAERLFRCAATSWDSQLYVSGGLTSKKVVSSSCYTCNPEVRAWFATASMNTNRMNHKMCCMSGLIYAIGGSNGLNTLPSVEKYLPFDDRWVVVSPMKHARERFGATVVNQFIFVFGGLDNSGKTIKVVERYDTLKNSWQDVAEIQLGYDIGAASWGTDIYISGGHTGVYPENNVVRFDSKSCVSVVISQLQFPRQSHGTIIIPSNEPGNMWEDYQPDRN